MILALTLGVLVVLTGGYVLGRLDLAQRARDAVSWQVLNGTDSRLTVALYLILHPRQLRAQR
jgi:hypothetical protein